VNGREVLSNIVVSQEALHKVYGGVVPEIACRAHIESILPIIDRALKMAKVKISDIDAIAVTNEPGLVGALLVGLSTAKALSLVLNKPLIGVNHLEAHLYASQVIDKKKENSNNTILYPTIGLVASGGHSTIFLMRNLQKYHKIGMTIDDAAGEAFDKVAAILGLPYPGGPSIEKSSMHGNPYAVKFPKGFADNTSLDFSFSGLKTAVLYYAKGQNATKNSPLRKGVKVSDIAASFQESVINTLVERVFQAVHKFKAKSVLVGGGVVANKQLRKKLQQKANIDNIKLIISPIRFCTDNAAMVAGLAYHKWKDRKINNLYLDAMPT
jgi:N6-L-threonylcarbamoyladenine synthase